MLFLVTCFSACMSFKVFVHVLAVFVLVVLRITNRQKPIVCKMCHSRHVHGGRLLFMEERTDLYRVNHNRKFKKNKSKTGASAMPPSAKKAPSQEQSITGAIDISLSAASVRRIQKQHRTGHCRFGIASRLTMTVRYLRQVLASNIR